MWFMVEKQLGIVESFFFWLHMENKHIQHQIIYLFVDDQRLSISIGATTVVYGRYMVDGLYSPT